MLYGMLLIMLMVVMIAQTSCNTSLAPPVNALLSSLEPTPPLWAQLSDSICSLDTPFEEDRVSECPAADYLALSQARLEVAVTQPSEPQLIDNIAVLIRAHLAACSMCDEFSL